MHLSQPWFNLSTENKNGQQFHLVDSKKLSVVSDFFTGEAFKYTPVARFTERLIPYLSPKTYLTTHVRPKTCLILKICIKKCHKSILFVN